MIFFLNLSQFLRMSSPPSTHTALCHVTLSCTPLQFKKKKCNILHILQFLKLPEIWPHASANFFFLNWHISIRHICIFNLHDFKVSANAPDDCESPLWEAVAAGYRSATTLQVCKAFAGWISALRWYLKPQMQSKSFVDMFVSHQPVVTFLLRCPSGYGQRSCVVSVVVYTLNHNYGKGLVQTWLSATQMGIRLAAALTAL